MTAFTGSLKYKLACSYNVKASNISPFLIAESYNDVTVLFEAGCRVASVSYKAGYNRASYARQPASSRDQANGMTSGLKECCLVTFLQRLGLAASTSFIDFLSTSSLSI